MAHPFHQEGACFARRVAGGASKEGAVLERLRQTADRLQYALLLVALEQLNSHLNPLLDKLRHQPHLRAHAALLCPPAADSALEPYKALASGIQLAGEGRAAPLVRNGLVFVVVVADLARQPAASSAHVEQQRHSLTAALASVAPRHVSNLPQYHVLLQKLRQFMPPHVVDTLADQ